MRLSRESSSPPDPATELRGDPAGPQIGLWGPFYFSLWLCAMMLAVVVLWPRQPELMAFKLAGWGVGLALAAGLACSSRIAMHDLLVGLTDRDRFLLGLFVLIPILLPAALRGPRIIPDGFLWATPTVMMLAVTPSLTRRLLALMLAGAWLASRQITDPTGLGLLLGFGLSWLVALGATHFAFTGDPHGLGGGWSIRKVLFNAFAAAIPASVAAIALWWAWPKAPPSSFPGPRLPQPIRLTRQLDLMEWEKLLWHGAVMIMLTLLTIFILHALRKFLLRRSGAILAANLIPGQVAQVEFQATPPPPTKVMLTGTRGKIVQLWGRWAAALGQHAELARRPGETAAAYAGRLARDMPDAAPPPAMTELLERAHYSQDEPLREELEAMQHFVREQARRLKAHGGKRGAK